jgi:general secretion pathway protein K
MRRTPPARGAALLAALLTVALVATLASAGLWQQWRAIEVETAERQRAQSVWVLVGALDWARLVLREDARAGTVDHLAEPWAIPLQEARLSTFLAAGREGTPGDAAGDAAFLSGTITDLQSRLNVHNLLESGRVSPAGLRAFERLFDLLGLPPTQLDTLVARLRLSGGGTRTSGGLWAQPAPGVQTDSDTQQVPLIPLRPEQLGWLGLPPSSVTTLLPYVTVLPGRTAVNLNTASPQVVYAAIGGIGLADARRLVAGRAARHLSGPADVARVLGQALPDDALVGYGSRFFEVRGQLRLDRSVMQVRTLVEREGLNVKPLQQQRGALEAPVPVALPGAR